MDIANNSRPRRPWVAFLLSLLTPGLGHVYNGDLTGGTIRYVVVIGGFSAALAAWAYLVPSVIGLVVVVAGMLATVVGIAVTAHRQSRRLPVSTPRFWYSRWYGLLGIFLVVSVVFDPIRSAVTKYFAQAYKIPAGSMLPTLAIGDHVYVTKLCYGAKLPFTDRLLVTFHPPERGDIVVLKYPEDESKDFIKRVVGIPGDVVEVRNKELYVNDVLADTSTIQHLDPATHVDRRDNFGPVTVPEHSYFVMGDNRDQSLDSRFWGFVQENKIRGKAVLIYWSWNGDDGVRWDRIGRRL
jgi:signal peptidase I